MPEAILRVEGLTRYFGDFLAVDHVSFEIQPGEVVGYLGPNGSGKTTTIRMLLGLLKPSEGRAEVMGYDSFTQTEEVRKRCGYMSQKFALYDDLTVMENLVFYGGVYGIRDRKAIQETIEMVGLTAQEGEVVKSLSAGWRQRMALGIALVHKPQVLFLDEPTSGVDPIARRNFWDLIYELAEEEVTIVATTHYMDEAEYCTRVGMMRAGRLLALDSPQVLKETVLRGVTWDAYAEPLLTGLELLPKQPGVLRVGLVGDHLRLIVERGVDATTFGGKMRVGGVSEFRANQVEPTLEDVFLDLEAR